MDYCSKKYRRPKWLEPQKERPGELLSEREEREERAKRLDRLAWDLHFDETRRALRPA